MMLSSLGTMGREPKKPSRVLTPLSAPRSVVVSVAGPSKLATMDTMANTTCKISMTTSSRIWMT